MQHQAETGIVETIRFEDRHGAAQHHHVRMQRLNRGWQKLASEAHGIEHVAHRRREEFFANQVEERRVVGPGHAICPAA